MCRGDANVFFGVFVRSLDLLHAALAWKKLPRPFLAIDMICQRRRNEQLSVKGRTRIVDVPEEVWELVKQTLAATEVRRAAETFACSMLCHICIEYYWRELGETRGPLKEIREILDCPDCQQNFFGGEGLSGKMESQEEVRFCLSFFLTSAHNSLASQDINALMEAFGLSRPDSRIVVQEGPYFDDENAISALSLAHHSLSTASPESNFNEGITGHEITSFDKPFFSVPSNAAGKIRSFCELFRLEMVDPAVPSYSSSVESASVLKKVAEPAWHLWATSTCEL
jgi:hypothetical protein